MNEHRIQKRDPDRSRAHWQTLLRQFAAGGRGVREFCAEHGVSPAAFYAWRRKLGGREIGTGRPGGDSPRGAAGGPLFLPLRVAGEPTRMAPPAAPAPVPAGGRVEVLLGGGVVVGVCGDVPAARLAMVLGVLEDRGVLATAAPQAREGRPC